MVKRMIGMIAALACAATVAAQVAPARKEDRPVSRVMLKLIVEHAALAPYLHPEVPGRVPVVVSDHLLAPGITPSKFGQPLRVLADKAIGAQAHLRFVSFDDKGSTADLVVEYKAEGIKAAFALKSESNGWWTVVDAEVSKLTPDRFQHP